MQPATSLVKKIMPLFTLFIIINCVAIILKKQLAQYNIDAMVLFGSNCILFAVSLVNIAMHHTASQNKNPNAVVRSMMVATLIKFVVIGSSVLIYIFIAGEKRNTYGIFGGMVLYVFYSVVETRITMKLKNKNGNN